MIDSSDTDPVIIRATYAARGRNRKLNIAKAESLGVAASSVSPTPGGSSGGGVSGGGTGVAASGGTQQVIDPTYTTNPDTPTYGDSTYQEQTLLTKFSEL